MKYNGFIFLGSFSNFYFVVVFALFFSVSTQVIVLYIFLCRLDYDYSRLLSFLLSFKRNPFR
jgi:hypothetical protein